MLKLLETFFCLFHFLAFYRILEVDDDDDDDANFLFQLSHLNV